MHPSTTLDSTAPQAVLILGSRLMSDYEVTLVNDNSKLIRSSTHNEALVLCVLANKLQCMLAFPSGLLKQ